MRAHKHYLPTLDGWRGIAIAMVVVSHAAGPAGRLMFRVGTFGVMLFFAISGFLICTNLLVEEESSGSISLRSFYIRRVFRILPAAYFYLLVIASLAAAGVLVVPWTDIAGAAAFISNYVVSQSWFTGHFWSLALEEHFYLLWPPLLVMLGRKSALWASAALIIVTIVCRQYVNAVDLPGYTQLRLDAFMFPCILAIILRNTRTADAFKRMMTPPVWCGVLVIVGVGIALGAVAPAWREPQRLLQSATLPILIAATVLRPGDWPGRILRHPALEWLGRVSYSVYLWQQLVFGLAPPAGAPRLLALPLLIVLILVLAIMSRRWIEQPMIGLGRRIVS